MKRWKFTEEQIVRILKEADAGGTVKDLCRRYELATATYYQWKSKYGGLEASDLEKLKELEHENARLKKIYADLSLENHALKDLHRPKALKPSERRDAAAFLVAEHGLSKKRAAVAVRVSHAALYRGPRQLPDDSDVVDALNGVVEKYPRWGFWKCYRRLRLDGQPWNHKRVRRVYREMRSNLPRRTKRRLP